MEAIPNGSVWEAIIGKHTGLRVRILSVTPLTVCCRIERNHNSHKVEGGNAFWRVPIDAFYRRYERVK